MITKLITEKTVFTGAPFTDIIEDMVGAMVVTLDVTISTPVAFTLPAVTRSVKKLLLPM